MRTSSSLAIYTGILECDVDHDGEMSVYPNKARSLYMRNHRRSGLRVCGCLSGYETVSSRFSVETRETWLPWRISIIAQSTRDSESHVPPGLWMLSPLSCSPRLNLDRGSLEASTPSNALPLASTVQHITWTVDLIHCVRRSSHPQKNEAHLTLVRA